MDQKIKTGEIIPRDYGIELKVVGKKKIFMSPSKYIIGKLMLESKRDINSRVKEKAEREGIDYQQLKEAFHKGIKRKDGTKNILNYSGSNNFDKVKNYGNTYFAKVKSKSGKDAFYEVQLERPWKTECSLSYKSVRCHCADNFWGDVKKEEVMCSHIAALEIALNIDNRTRKSKLDNLTGLTPKHRGNYELPFEVLKSKNQNLMTDVIFDHYVENKTHFEINKHILDNENMLSDALYSDLNLEWDRAQFKVLRQKEKETDNFKLRRFCGAVKALEERLSLMLREKQFFREGYNLENKGTSHEIVAQRFRKKDLVYSLCIQENELPYLVKKNLGDKLKSENRYNREDSPFSRVGEKYLSVDDPTRRECLTQIIVPGIDRNSQVSIPSWMKRKYELICER